jgi:hypothetical protein
MATRAIATRCRWPLDSSAGIFSHARQADAPSSFMPFYDGRLVMPAAQHLLPRRRDCRGCKCRKQFKVLKHADAARNFGRSVLGSLTLMPSE